MSLMDERFSESDANNSSSDDGTLERTTRPWPGPGAPDEKGELPDVDYYNFAPARANPESSTITTTSQGVKLRKQAVQVDLQKDRPPHWRAFCLACTCLHWANAIGQFCLLFVSLFCQSMNTKVKTALSFPIELSGESKQTNVLGYLFR